MRIGLFWRVLPVHILIVMFLAFPLWQRHEASVDALRAGNLAQAQLSSSHQAEKHIDGMPVKLVIPKLAIDIAVTPQNYDPAQKSWPVAPYLANYATNTVRINDSRGSTLIYGHWTPAVFGPTKLLAAGDTAYVYTDNKHVFKYAYSDKVMVKPTQTQIMGNLKGKPRLVLMTCDGSWAQNRRLMFFNLVSAK